MTCCLYFGHAFCRNLASVRIYACCSCLWQGIKSLEWRAFLIYTVISDSLWFLQRESKNVWKCSMEMFRTINKTDLFTLYVLRSTVWDRCNAPCHRVSLLDLFWSFSASLNRRLAPRLWPSRSRWGRKWSRWESGWVPYCFTYAFLGSTLSLLRVPSRWFSLWSAYISTRTRPGQSDTRLWAESTTEEHEQPLSAMVNPHFLLPQVS